MRIAAILASSVALCPLAAPLGTPSLNPGESIRAETGEITVGAAAGLTVVRYTWRDSAGLPRSVALVPASGTTGYAVRMTYVTGGNTVNLDSDPTIPDGGFGYFVSHELFRSFPDTDDTIASRIFGADDSPLGRYLASTGSASSVGTGQAAHEFRLNYPRYGTVNPVANIGDFPAPVLSVNAADYQLFQLPVTIRWHFVAGQDYPLWTVDDDLSAAGANRIANDVRGPYGVVQFNNGQGFDVTTLKWGDKYHFSADAFPQEFAARSASGTLAWSWNQPNGGRRYNVLSNGAYEFGLVQTVTYALSRLGDGFSDNRGTARGAGGAPCGGGGVIEGSLPCTFEWSYQSFQFDAGPPARPKIAWGSSPFLGTNLPSVFLNGNETEPISGLGHVSYGVHLVFGSSGAGTSHLTTDRAAAPMEPNPTLTVAAAGNGTVTYTVLGDTGGPYGASANPKVLAPWSSVRLTATPGPGTSFQGWSGGCAGVASATCILAMDQAKSVTASFGAVSGSVNVSPTSLGFGGQSMGTTSPAQAITVTNNTAAPVAVAISQAAANAAGFFQANDCGASLAVGASCTLSVTFAPPAAAGALNAAIAAAASLVVAGTPVSLSGTAEKSLVTHFYRAILRRPPDAGGKAFWQDQAAQAAALGVNVNETWYAMALTFYNGAEYAAFSRDDTAFLTDLYRTFFNREPDAGGLAFWLGQIAAGSSRDAVLLSFLFSAEFRSFTQAIFGNTAARAEIDVVGDFYRGLLGRFPDTPGLTFWIGQFRAAQCQGATSVQAQAESISASFANGAEYLNRNRSNAQFVDDMYNAFLRRGADPAGSQFWVGRLQGGGVSRDFVRQQFRASPEFSARVQAVVAQGCLP